MARVAPLACAALALAMFPAAASADITVLDFESAPPPIDSPITTQYQASNFTYFQQSDGFRPYRETVAPSRAQSGTVVADIGPSHCFQETGGTCEFVVGGTTARFTHTAQSVTVYTGFLQGPAVPDVQLKLTAYRTNGLVAATATSSDISSPAIKTPVTVTSAAPDIEHVRMDIVSATSNNVGAELAVDDLTLNYPTGSLPDFSVSAPGGPFAALQGKTTDVPVTLNRLNGSSGNVTLSASGQPSGVSASFTPNPVPATQTAATMHLTAASTAPPFDNPQTVTVTADPSGNASVGPGLRTTSTLLRVGANFVLKRTAATPGVAGVPACGSVDVPFTLSRDRTFGQTVTLSVSGVPANVTAQLLPGTTIAPGGGFDVAAAVRLHGDASFVSPTFITVMATSPGSPDQTLQLAIGRGTTKATVDQATGTPPRYLLHGSFVHVTANGICPGTRYSFGAESFSADVDANGLGFSFTVPRGARTGPVTIIPPAGTGATAATSNSITITPFSSTEGFPFDNFTFGHLSYSELVEEYGDGLFIHVNPCIFVDCTINTYILDPTVLVVWPVLDYMLGRSGGHCFGISRGIQEMLSGSTRLTRFNPSGKFIHDLGSTSGPGSSLGDWLDAKHSAQGSAQFIYAWATRDKNLQTQWNRAHDELALGRSPIITLQNGSFLSGQGHAILAFDERDVPDGHDILVYDNNSHDAADGTQVIHISSDWHSWSFKTAGGGTWTGGQNTLFAVRHDDIPTTPELPGIGSLVDGLTTIFGSAGGAAQTTSVSPGEDGLPVLDDHAVRGSAGVFVAARGRTQALHTIKGTKTGTYDEAFIGPGFAASVQGVSTRKGVKDTIGGSGRRHSISFASGVDRPLAVTLGDHGGAVSSGATVATHVEHGHTDVAALGPGGALFYAHTGSPTTTSFTLTTVQKGGALRTFVSPRVLVRGGEQLTARLTSDGRALLTRVLHGHRRLATLSSVAQPAARLRLGRLTLQGGRARLKLGIDRLSGAAVLGAGLQVIRGHTVVARRGLTVSHVRGGSRTLSFRLPKLASGRYIVAVQIELLAGTTVVRTSSLRRRFSVRVG